MSTTKREPAHTHEIGTRVQVQVDDHRGLRWYDGVVTDHTRIGTALGDGWPTFTVQADDGTTYHYASPECVRLPRAQRGAR